MNKVAHYLQQHLSGEILASPKVLDYFSTDESILQLRPQLVVYPRSEGDIRKAARFTWQLAEKGRIVPITARGMGSDQTGAALGSGMIMAMPAHMNKIIELDSRTGVVAAEAGISLEKLQQVLYTHGRQLPPVSAVNKYATLGGAVANNDTGRSSYKYGPMLEFVRGLRVVLANGELIETRRISKREFNKKLGLASFEGEIYRSLDKLIEESHDVISTMAPVTNKSSAGYNISDVKNKDGSFDLTPLFLGSQGTLGVITEVVIDTLPHNPTTDLLAAGFGDRRQAWQAVEEINRLKSGPSAIDFVDVTLIEQLQQINPAILKPLQGGVPAVLLFMDIDDEAPRTRKRLAKKLEKIMESYGAEVVHTTEEDVDQWERLRDSASVYLTHSHDKLQPVPVLDDAQIPIERMAEFFDEVEKLMKASSLPVFAAWGQAGNGMVHIAPMVDISSVGDRQKLFKVMDAYYGYVCKIGGCTAGEYAEGRMRGLYGDKLFQPQGMELFTSIKKIFDPSSVMNPGVKINVKLEDIKPLVRSEYSLDHQYSHLPRS